MKFTKEQQDLLKHCGEHFEILTGGRGHSKTKEVIEDMQQEIERLNNILDDLERYMNTICLDATFEEVGITRSILKRLKELKENK